MCIVIIHCSGKSKIFNLLESEDVINALKAVKKIGANI